MRPVWLTAIAMTLAGLIMIGFDSVAGGMERGPYDHKGASASEMSAPDSCVICHGSESDQSAVESNRLCLECHRSIAEKGVLKYQHEVVVDEKYPNNDCEGCHRMHKSPAVPQLVTDELKLCYGCHPEERDYKSHPVVTFTDELGQTKSIFGEDARPITCASHCHEIHGSDFRYLCSLEPGRELCISCHSEFR